MQARSRTFEVQVERDGRWVMEQAPDVRAYADTIKSDGFSVAWRDIANDVPEKKRHFTRCLALASVMGGAGDWITKVQTLLQLFDPAGEKRKINCWTK